ncbi:hypothetical protein ACFXAZ_02980 [Streptomyces sp. NPDC059477]|uniref:hypothetical protein n=1 Tax=Streptomyces sp. NPDC059477 TaxID=3346847 RepID=UPI003698A26A
MTHRTTDDRAHPSANTRARASAGSSTSISTGPPRRRLPLLASGRHRRPRPRKALLAVAGLALAFGALSLVPPGTDSVTAGPRAARAEPGTGPEHPPAVADRSTHAASTLPGSATPEPGRSATSAMEGLAGTPLPDATDSDAPPADAETPPATTRGATASVPPPSPGATKQPPTLPRPQPTPPTTTSPPNHTTTPPPQPSPEPPTQQDPGLCIPLIGLCLGGILGG